jgi:hypothetical protein
MRYEHWKGESSQIVRRGLGPERGSGTHGEIGEVDGCPRDVFGHAWNGVDGDFSCCDEDDMDHPCT